MPTPRLITISAWSYSRFGVYDLCPRKAKFLYISKLKEPDSDSGLKGTRTHALAAVVASGKVPPLDRDNAAFYPELKALVKSRKLPPELDTFAEEFKALRKTPGVRVEESWAFTRDWVPTGWFAGNAWLRIKVDLHYLATKKQGFKRVTTVYIRDHKTGKMKDDHKLQRSLYALGALIMYPDAVAVEAAHWYLDAGEEKKDVFQASQLEELKAEWLNRTTAMLNDTSFATHAGQHCNWCHFRKANGGPCTI